MEQLAPILHLSEATSLALHSMALLAKLKPEEPNVGKLAQLLGVSSYHLAKVMQKLGKAGLVGSMRGPKGGFHLLKPAGRITLFDVYQAMEGQRGGGYCLLKTKVCPFKHCLLEDMPHKLSQDFYTFLKHQTLSALALK